MNKIKISPLGARVLTEQAPTEKIKNGIIIPDTAKETPMEATIVALGTGELDENGNKIPFEVAVGDRVLVAKYGGTEIKIDNKEFKIYNTTDILAIIKTEE